MSSGQSFSFLQELVDKLFLDYPVDLSKLCLITPNRRSKLFIKHYLKEKGKAVLVPQIFSIDDFIQHLSPYTVLDQLDLSFELFTVYKHLEGENAQSFEAFLQWSPVLINDFNEIDMHLANANTLFTYLSDDYAIREWNLGRKDLSDFQKNYLAFFHKLNDYYQYFIQKILSQNTAYNGLAYKYVAEHIEELTANKSWEKLIFAGFNALTLSEEKIIRTLYQNGKAEIYWDVDAYYFKDKMQEAGLFFRKYSEWFNFDEAVLSNHFRQAKEIHIIAAPKAVSQAKIASELIRKEKLNNSALVLADESLLVPVLNSLDEKVLEETNITMGYPLKNTAAHLVFRLFLRMQFNAQRQQKLKNLSVVRFLRDDILQLLNNPIVKSLLINNEALRSDLKKQLFWSIADLSEVFNQNGHKDISYLFRDFRNNATEAINFFHDFIYHFLAKYKEFEQQQALRFSSDLEAFLNYSKLLNRLSDRIQKFSFPDNLQEFKIVFEQLIGNQAQSFHGEPLKGLQLMGLLETRVLDFEHLILLSANENILPSGKMSNSFIPVDIKRIFKLPTYKEKNAIFAYHFYRLLQRAKSAHIIYSTSADKLYGAEKSRFITQLLLELPKYNSQVQFKQQLFNFKEIKPQNKIEIRIDKEDEILKKLKSFSENGISPTAISYFVSCPLRFYFRYIVHIDEPFQDESSIDDRLFGEITHNVLEKLFKLVDGKKITPGILDDMQKSLPDILETQINSFAPNQIVDTGQNLLTIKAMEKYLSEFLREEKRLCISNTKRGGNWEIIGLEKKLDKTIELSKNKISVKLKGTVDRIDKWNEMIRVFDYKTGQVDSGTLKNIDLESLFLDSKYEKAAQILFYAWLVKDIFPSAKLQSGIIALRNINNPYSFINDNADERISAETLDVFESQLMLFLEGLFDEKIPFSQTDDQKKCQYCTYIHICLK